MNKIDNICFILLLSVLFSAIVFSSEVMGGLALLFSGFILFKNIFGTCKFEYKLNIYEKTLVIYFLIVTVTGDS